MAIKNPLPAREDVQGYPDNDKAVMVNARGKIRVVERQYYWDKEKNRGLEKRLYLGYVVDGKFYSNESYKKKYKRNGTERPEYLKATGRSRGQENAKPAENRPLPYADVKISSRQADELPLYYAAAKESGLIRDLAGVFGAETAAVILSVAFHWLSSGDNAGYIYNSWKEGRLLPYDGDISGAEMEDFFCGLGRMPSWRQKFFGARLKRIQDEKLVCWDASEIVAEVAKNDYSRLWLGRSGGFQQKTGLVLLLGHKTSMPVLFKVLPGITDITTVQDMLCHFDEINEQGKRIFATVAGNSAFSLKNLASFIDHKSRVIMPAGRDAGWVEEVINETISKPMGSADWITSNNCYGRTYPLEMLFDDGKKRKLWVHVYYSYLKRSIEVSDFYQQLEKFETDWPDWEREAASLQDGADAVCPLNSSPLMKYFVKGSCIPGKKAPERNSKTIDKDLAAFGYFANVSTMECSAEDALENCNTEGLIAKTFKSARSPFPADHMHSCNDTMEGRLLVSFAALSIITHIYAKMSDDTVIHLEDGSVKILRPLLNEMTFEQVKNSLSGVRLASSGDGTEKRYWTGVTDRHHSIAQRLGYPGLFTDIPVWG